MKWILFFLILSVSLVSCNRRFDRLRNQAQTVEQTSSEQNKDNTEEEAPVVQNEFNVDIFSGDVALIVRKNGIDK